ncbi:MAG: thioredoxin family protein [Thermomicrobiales bacterium]
MSQITLERFQSGEQYADYRQRILATTGLTNDLLVRSEAGLATEEIDTSAFAALPEKLRALVLHFDECSDSADTLPILERIEKETGKIEVRIVERDDNPDLRDSHLNRGAFASVPVVIFLDRDFNEIGHFIERPDSVTALRAKRRDAIHLAHLGADGITTPPNEIPDEVRAAILADVLTMREEVRPFLISETVRELNEIVAPLIQPR